jgi:CRP-like cAMP-binding protein
MPAPIELLKQVPLFQRLTDKQVQKLATEFSERTFEAGKELTVDGETRRTLGPGDYFGEIALIDGGARTATITAVSDGKAYGLTPWSFRPLVEGNASIAWPLLEAMAARVRELEQKQ